MVQIIVLKKKNEFSNSFDIPAGFSRSIRELFVLKFGQIVVRGLVFRDAGAVMKSNRRNAFLGQNSRGGTEFVGPKLLEVACLVGVLVF